MRSAQSGPNNEGLRRARGRYVAFLNHDDLYFPDHLERLVDWITAVDADFVWSPFLVVLPSAPAALAAGEWNLRVHGVPADSTYDPRLFLFASAWLLRRELADVVGPWCASHQTFATPSQDWLLRAWKAGARMRVRPAVTLMAVPAGLRPGSYADPASAEHDYFAAQMRDNPRFREEALGLAALAAEREARQYRLGRALRSLIVRPAATASIALGMHPLTPYFALRYGRRGNLRERDPAADRTGRAVAERSPRPAMRTRHARQAGTPLRGGAMILPAMPRRSLPRVVLALVACALTASGAAQAPATRFDVVIRGGRVLDGMGNPWISADVAIRDGRIARIGRVPEAGRTEIDASGRYVSPGWIDMMDQSGGVLPTNGLAANKLRMGVTAAIGGEGGTPVPAAQVAEYFAGLERTGISLNFGSYYSEAQARTAVLGHTARAPTAEELEAIKDLMAAAMRGGAMGMSTALIYPPGSFAATAELVEVAKVAGAHGGIYATHMRDEGKALIPAIEEAIAIGEQGRLPVEIFHLKAAHQPGWGTLMREAGRTIEAARARGVDVAADMYVYTAGGTGLEASIPTWAQEGGVAALKARLADPEIRERLKREMATGLPGWSNLVEAAGGWPGVVLANARNAANARFVGKSLADIGREWQKDPADAAMDLVAEGDGRVMAIYHMMSEPDVEAALGFPWTSIGSDAGASLAEGGEDPTGLTHPRAYGNFPRVIARYVRDRGVLTLEAAIRKMTSWPATRMRLAGRGALKEGLWADVVVFDLATLDDRATYDAPRESPAGIDYVLVNGVVVIDHGRHTGARPGQVLYGAGRVAP